MARQLRVLVATASALAIAVLIPTPARAAAAPGVAYVRLAHLSPDGPEVDVYLTPLSAGSTVKKQKFPGVGYGVVSAYLSLPPGAYRVAMRLANAPESEPAKISADANVVAGKAYTVAGTGHFDQLGLTLIEDDLSLPAAGKSKVRILQASVRAPVLTVTVSNGETIASGLQFATSSPYKQVSAGRWNLSLKPAGGGSATPLAVNLAAGNVYSVIVLDGPDGLSAELRTDAGRDGPVPADSVDAGRPGSTTPLYLAGAGAALLAVLGFAAMAAARRRRGVWR